jgi:hypothetical protein
MIVALSGRFSMHKFYLSGGLAKESIFYKKNLKKNSLFWPVVLLLAE